jgi:hypothetical protein
MKEIIYKLLVAVQRHPDVVNSILGLTKHWKRAQYNVLSEILSEQLAKSEFMQGSKKNDLGTTISGVTLYRIFTNDHSESDNSDLRFLKSLDKIAIFLGYSNLNSFLNNEMNTKQSVLSKKDVDKLFLEFQELVRNSCLDEFNHLQKLPVIDLEDYPKYTFHESPLSKRLIDNLYLNSKLQYQINLQSNKSIFELYDFKLVSIDESSAIISVEELWNLDWVDGNGDVVYVLNNLNRQTYFIRKIDDVWKIWDNFNPIYETFISHLNENTKDDEPTK